MKGRERFPVGLTLAALVVFAICAGLGVWQLQRAAWKARVLGQIAARARAPAQPIGPVLARAAHGEDVAFTRVAVKCGPSKLLETGAFLSGVDAGQWAWHPIAYCGRPAWERYDSIPVDRGVLDSSRGGTVPPHTILPQAQYVEGVLVPAGRDPLYSLGRPAPYILMAEREEPAPSGVTPNHGIADTAPDNLQYVGAYAPTWFGLAGVLAGVYAALLWRRLRP